MSCEGYEHNQKVVLAKTLPSHAIPIGTVGVVARIDAERHMIDVVFARFGRLNHLDPHLFQPLAEGAPPSQARGAL